MRLEIKNHSNYYKYSGLTLVLAGLLLMLPRMIEGNGAGPSPVMGIVLLIIGIRYYRKSVSHKGE